MPLPEHADASSIPHDGEMREFSNVFKIVIFIFTEIKNIIILIIFRNFCISPTRTKSLMPCERYVSHNIVIRVHSELCGDSQLELLLNQIQSNEVHLCSAFSFYQLISIPSGNV